MPVLLGLDWRPSGEVQFTLADVWLPFLMKLWSGAVRPEAEHFLSVAGITPPPP